MRDIKIALAVVCYRVINPKTYLSLAKLIAETPYEVVPMMDEGPNQLENRERLVRKAQNERCSHILFIDSDMCFSSDLLEKLFDHKKDIVGAEYKYRELPPRSVIKTAPNTPLAEEHDEVFKCYSIGGGCVLIQMSVFNRIDLPWFHTEPDDMGSTKTGHDVFFCQQATKAGIDIWCDPTINIKHIGDYLY